MKYPQINVVFILGWFICSSDIFIECDCQVAGATEPGAKATKSMVLPLLQLGVATAANHRRARRIQRRMGSDTNKVPNIQKSIM